MQIDKVLFQTMLREFWSINNELCEDATIIFLKMHDFSDSEIEKFLDMSSHKHIKGRNLAESKKIFDEKVKETRDYYLD